LRDVRVASRNESTRVQELQLVGMTPSKISGQELRMAVGRTLGWQYIQSTLFDLTRRGNSVRLRGHGYGHAVGMCVIGSGRLAAAGRSATEILEQYFPGTTIGAIPSPGSPSPAAPVVPSPTLTRSSEPIAAPAPTTTSVPSAPLPGIASASAPAVEVSAPSRAVALPAGSHITLPEADAGERGELETFMARERDRMSSALGMPPPESVSLRFHPGGDVFQSTTGQPWYVLGTVLDNELHFMPLATLRERGVLERTMRRELVRSMIGEALAGRPLWVREGAAIHFSEGSNGPVRRDPCPRDPELMSPGSVGELTDAYARARACVERQLSAGKAWTDIR
jgi:hypothetical protein